MNADIETSLKGRISSQNLTYTPWFWSLPSRALELVREIEWIQDPKLAERLLEHAKNESPANKPYGQIYPIQMIKNSLSKRLINILFN